MKLQSPFIISARLLPALVIDGVTISYNGGSVFFDGPAWEYEEKTFRAPPCGDLQDAFAAILSFLGAFAEARSYQQRTGRESENASLFPEFMGEWADKNSDEFSMLGSEIEEYELITEE